MKPLPLVVIFLGLITLNQARADQSDKTGKVTFNDAVQIPGAVLDGGTYTFKLLDRTSDRHVVQIFNAAGTKLMQTVLAIPNTHLQSFDKTFLMYAERPAAQPQALEAWFCPGEHVAEVFVYPRSEAKELSRLNNTIVPTYEYEVDKNIATSTSPAGEVSARSNMPKRLPHTSSQLPLIGFGGLALLILAAGFHLLRSEKS